MVPLESVPAEVGATGVLQRLVVDLLPGELADVADRNRAGRPVEAEPEGIAEADRVDLAPPPDRVGEGVVDRGPVTALIRVVGVEEPVLDIARVEGD